MKEIIARYYLYNMKIVARLLDKFDILRANLGRDTMEEIYRLSTLSVKAIIGAMDAGLTNRVLSAIFHCWQYRTVIGYGVLIGKY